METRSRLGISLKKTMHRIVASGLFALSAFGLCMPMTAQAVTFSGADSRVVYTGRTQLGDDSYSPNGKKMDMNWTGSEARIRFRGSTTIRAAIRGITNPGYAVGTEVVYFLDGSWLRRENVGGDWGGTTTIASGLSTGEHTLVIRRDGDGDNRLWIQAIFLDNGGELLQAPAVNSARKIEIYGDSVTAVCCTIQQSNSTEDGDTWGGSNYYTYGARTGRAFNADTRIIAKGGMGQSTGFYFHNLRQVWNKYYSADNAPVYPLTSWVPDVVVHAMGQNDQFQYDPNTDWYGTLKTRYVDQIRDYRRVYPNAHIICMNTTMTDPNFLNGVWQAVQALNDPRVHFLRINKQTHSGHPNGNDHISMAQLLQQKIQQVTGWTASGGGGIPTGWTNIKNRWTNGPIHVEWGDHQTPNVGGESAWHSAQWQFESVGSGYYRIRNRWQGTFLHIEWGDNTWVASTNGNPDWHSAHWALEPTGSGYYRIRNRWKNTYLHNEWNQSQLRCTTIGDNGNWHSAQWYLSTP